MNERTWRRWLAGETNPDGHSAKSVALEIWREFTSTKGEEYKSAVLAAIKQAVPEVPCENWTEATFGAWFFDLAEREQGRRANSELANPLTADLDLLVWRPQVHDFISVRASGGRPLRAGDGVRVEVRARVRLHFYLMWVTFERERRLHAPFHPWNGRFEAFDQARDVALMELALPSEPKGVWSVEEPAPSLETLILLARRQPLSPELVRALPEDFGGIVRSATGRLNLSEPGFLHEFAHPQELAKEESGRELRLPDFTRTVPIQDPVYQLNRALRERMSGHFELIRTLTVAYLGKEKSR